MITYENNGQIALVTNINDTGYIVSTYASYLDFKTAQAPLSNINFNGPVNYERLTTHFSGWNIICRNDAGVIIECGELPQPEVPSSVSARQIRLWLIANGISLSQIDNLIEAMPDPQQREYTRVEWEYAPYIERNHPMVATFATALNLSNVDIDNAFIEAVTL
jgi:hypothetical protein